MFHNPHQLQEAYQRRIEKTESITSLEKPSFAMMTHLKIKTTFTLFKTSDTPCL
jgi:hypothetical protein